MADKTVSFELISPRNFIGARYYRVSRILVEVEAIRVASTFTIDADAGQLVFKAGSLIGAAGAFNNVGDRKERFPNVGPFAGRGDAGDVHETATTVTLDNITVTIDVAIERRWNSTKLQGKKGPAGRQLAVPEFRAKARTIITAKFAETIERMKKAT